MEHGEINVAVEAYLRAYMQPPLTAEQIYLGQQNNSALPKTREHVVFFLASTRRIGTNVGEQIVTEAGTTETRSYREYVVNVDFATPIINEHCSGLNILKLLVVLILRLTFSKRNTI